MPELPEVETFRTTLSGGAPGQAPILDRTVVFARLFWPRTLAQPEAHAFLAQMPGRRFAAMARRGKYLLFRLDVGYFILHLRMSGDLRLAVTGSEDAALHERMRLEMDDGRQISFVDPRKFGRAWLVDDPLTVIGGLGPEPLDPHFAVDDFHARLQTTRRQLKPLLLDQTFIAGLGNIYTDESLHMARLHPLRSAHSINVDDAARLLDAIRSVLQEGIRRNGTSIDWVYRGGEFQHQLSAYGQTGKPCPVCGALIQRITVGQRGTHFCPSCQI